MPRTNYRIGLPREGRYACCFNSDAGIYGGSDHVAHDSVQAEHRPWHGRDHSADLTLPPLSVLVLRQEG